MINTIKGLVRGLFAPEYAEGTEQIITINPRGEKIIAVGLPDLTELIRLGGSFYGTHATPGASLAATIPTTGAVAGLWNGEQVGGKSYVVTGLLAHCAVSNAAATQATLFACLSSAPLYAVPGTEDTSNIRGLIAGRLYNGKGKICKTITVSTAPVASTWMPIGKSIEDSILTGTVGMAIGGKLPEVMILPPGFYIAAATCAQATTATWTFTFIWHEIQLRVA